MFDNAWCDRKWRRCSKWWECVNKAWPLTSNATRSRKRSTRAFTSTSGTRRSNWRRGTTWRWASQLRRLRFSTNRNTKICLAALVSRARPFRCISSCLVAFVKSASTRCACEKGEGVVLFAVFFRKLIRFCRNTSHICWKRIRSFKPLNCTGRRIDLHRRQNFYSGLLKKKPRTFCVFSMCIVEIGDILTWPLRTGILQLLFWRIFAWGSRQNMKNDISNFCGLSVENQFKILI